jgi:hypothetical protein
MFAKCVASKHLWRSMAAKHGTRRRYNEGCRCEDCTADNTAYHQEYRQRLIGAEPANPSSVVTVSSPVTPGPVEAGVEAEIAELADARPGLAAAALALARILDNPRAVSSQPAGRGEGAGDGEQISSSSSASAIPIDGSGPARSRAARRRAAAQSQLGIDHLDVAHGWAAYARASPTVTSPRARLLATRGRAGPLGIFRRVLPARQGRQGLTPESKSLRSPCRPLRASGQIRAPCPDD